MGGIGVAADTHISGVVKVDESVDRVTRGALDAELLLQHAQGGHLAARHQVERDPLLADAAGAASYYGLIWWRYRRAARRCNSN